jgi:hypothetical protein
LKWVRQDLYILLVEFVEQAVLDAASKSSSEPASKSGLLRLAAEECLTMKRVRSRLLAREKGGSHLHAFRSKSEGCHNSARVSNSACGDDRELTASTTCGTSAIVPVSESSDDCRKEPRWPPASKP